VKTLINHGEGRVGINPVIYWNRRRKSRPHFYSLGEEGQLSSGLCLVEAGHNLRSHYLQSLGASVGRFSGTIRHAFVLGVVKVILDAYFWDRFECYYNQPSYDFLRSFEDRYNHIWGSFEAWYNQPIWTKKRPCRPSLVEH
jgi:hypothetical protein